MLEQLKEQVCQANLDLVKHGLVTLSWGNVSGISAGRKHVVVKVSGVSYDSMRLEHMVVVDLEGNVVEKHYLRKHGPTAYYGQGTNRS